jgi:dTDP-4-dehydrorhamnose reductase
MKIVVLGKNGQLGKEFVNYLTKHKNQFFAFSREEIDVANFAQVSSKLREIKPDVVINCSAYNNVDRAETDIKAAFLVNHLAVQNLAATCLAVGSKFVHYSTDYVFDGTKLNSLYCENDKPNPLNEYGKSKLAGEIAIKHIMTDYLIFRVSWVYGNGNQNFPYRLLQWSKSQPYLTIAYDEFSKPTPTDFIVQNTMTALSQNLQGLYHLVPDEYCSRYEWAKMILKNHNITKFIRPVSRHSFNLPAHRGEFLAMDNNMFFSAL